MRHKTLAIVVAVLMVLTTVTPALAYPPAPDDEAPIVVRPRTPRPVKPIDQPNPKDYWRNRERQRLLEAGKTAEAEALQLTGEERVLVILVEFAGTDVFTWTAGVSTWDPYGITDPTGELGQGVYDEAGYAILGDCSNIITQTTVFTYTGPAHNEIPRPLSGAADEASATEIWTEDFSNDWFNGFMFGEGVVISYTMQDGTPVLADFTGQSVADYYTDMSSGVYTITGDVIGWLPLDHSTWWYGADACPGARVPGGSGADSDDGIPGAGTYITLVRDALDAVNAISDTIPGFDWADYDLDGDGIIDRLWVVHSGYGEEDGTVLLDRTDYGEGAIWSHSAAVTPPYSVTQDIAAGPYIMMPENGGINVFAHEAGHNLGADDVYAYGHGETSAGFWSLMGDSWTGHPIGFEPAAMDPWHLDNWGWLDPFVITDTDQVYEITLGQASRFPGGDGVYRGAKIQLPDGILSLAVPPWQESYYWWGGKENLANARMTTVDPIAIPAGGATLSFDLAYDIETGGWDFLWVQVSTDGTTWNVEDTLTNDETQCETNPAWIGPLYGFPDDLCAAGIGGFYGHSADWPDHKTQEFDLSAYAGESVYLRFWYMTDWGTTGFGPFVDNVKVTADTTTLFEDDAEGGDANWDYEAPWQRSDGTRSFTHNYYLQWRNTGEDGGYDSTLGEERWRFGPANTGLLVWYNNNFYTDNEIYNYLEDDYSFGPKGRMLLIDSHPEPYRLPGVDPHPWIGSENTNLTTRGLVGDAPFSLWDTVDLPVTGRYVGWPSSPVVFPGQPAVSEFHDSLGYYPGVSSSGDGTFWSTVDWDASAAVPAKGRYSVKGGSDYPGFHVQYIGDHYFEPIGWYGFWSGGTGGTGNPRDDNVQYGWHVKILEQTAMSATVRVWNSVVHKRLGPAPADITAPGVYTFTYQVALHNDGGLDPANATVTMTVPSDLNIVDFSPGPPDGTVLVPPPGTPELPYRVVWADYSLTECEWITFTTVTTVEVKLGDPPTEWLAGVDVFDGSTWPPEHDAWQTRASQFAVSAAPVGPSSKVDDIGTTVTYTVRITNTGHYTDTFNLTASSVPGSWTASVVPTTTGDLAAMGGYADAVVSVLITDTAQGGDSAVTTLRATSVNDPMAYAEVALTTIAKAKIFLPIVMRNYP